MRGLKERVWTAATLLSLSTPGLVWGPAASATPGRLLEMQTLRSYSRHNHNLPFTISQVMCIHIEGREALFFSPFFFTFFVSFYLLLSDLPKSFEVCGFLMWKFLIFRNYPIRFLLLLSFFFSFSIFWDQ